ncbi:MAG: hypothetical protein KC478_06875 [Bacteriovoracaceae bacterium]|nr:hypothetical protein [Bacteriovoracaceae bacterium]
MRMPIFLILLIFTSCSDHVELRSKSGIFYLEDVEVELDELKNVEWRIGKDREAQVSKGLQFKVGVPSLSRESAITLQNKNGIDSWLFKFSKITHGSKRHLGYVMFGTGPSVTQNFTVHLYYHAASVSSEFRKFKCPAFNHRLKLDDFEMSSTARKRHRNEIFVRPNEHIKGRVTQLSFAPVIFSSGKSMRGSYLVELALYNSKERRTYSDWIPEDGIVKVDSEVMVKVDSCIGVSEETSPSRSKRSPRIQDLQIR